MSAFELSVVADGPNLTASPTTPPSISRERYGELATRARLLSWLSMVVITAEAVVGIVAGLIAVSIALVAFGLDSVIEGLASGIIIWCFTGSRTFIQHPETSYVGIALAVTSAITMPLIGQAKQKIAVELGPSATAGEGRQNMLCAYLAGALLVGLLGNALVGAWWLDPFVGLAVAFVAVKEGIDSWKGESCCTSSPLDGFAADSCEADDCCA